MINKNNIMKELVVTEAAQLLSFLLLQFKGKSRNYVKGLLTHKQIMINGRVVTKYDSPLKIGQTVTVLKEGKTTRDKTDILKIIYEDDDILVINKQAGLLAVSTGKNNEQTAYGLITEYVKKKDSKGRIFVVHRLDRDTSGVFLVAKNELMKKALQDRWNEIVTLRGYIAVVEGCPANESGTITSYLLETSTHLMYSAKGETDDGQLAVTHYSVVGKNETYALIDVSIDTGRKNQIRVHLKDIGCPVVGDKKYGSVLNPLNRLGLHAEKLELTNPVTGKTMSFCAPVPGKFYECIK